jgi:cobalt-zinc-cadmium efflux system outer membrane protein
MVKGIDMNTRQDLIIAILLCILTLTFVTVGYSQTEEKALVLNDLINTAIEQNPQLKSMRSAFLADSAKITQEGALPDPVLSLGLMNLPVNSFAFDQEPMTGKQIAINQLFPFPGKLSLKEDISSEDTEISRTNYQEYRNQLIRDVTTEYYNLFVIDKSIEITEKNQALLKEYTEIAQSRYRVGKGLQQDVLKAQVELSKMIDKLIKLKQERRVKQARINALLNQPVNTPLGRPIEPGYAEVDQDPDSLLSLAKKNRPLLKGWECMRKQSTLRVDLAKKDYWPNIGVFVAYTQRDMLQNGSPGYDFLSGGVSLNLPVYSGSKQSKKVAESIYNEDKINERYQQVLNQLNFDLDERYSSLIKNSELIDLFRTGIIPQAEQSLASALTGYQTDKVDFLTLVNNQITLFNYQLDYYRVLGAYQNDQAGLVFLTGVQSTVKVEE